MPEPHTAQRKASQSESSESDQQAWVLLTARLLLRESLTARRAAGTIAGFTFLIPVGGVSSNVCWTTRSI